ncbi:hypothetical protein QJS04_geneDACA011951 [Acorus gramineus]|uniref:WD and tetratricopeptide repeats protein 1 n=1 Tax=Acorus gramineus TaxID=55184 RepID=A0AAV9AI06_ACOGR|nr:hypothetical protein QJS04_geneDACA011951 [Acorus gramineus]
MESWGFPDGNIIDLLEKMRLDPLQDINHKLQMHSSLVRRLSLEKELEGHQSCVNALAWNSSGSLLISGSDDTRINIWSYKGRRLLHSIETGHNNNIFCTKFVPETSDELVVSAAADAEVRLFNLSRLSRNRHEENALEPSAIFQCHSRRIKKLAVEVGNANVVWSASEDGTLRQHDFREGSSCPPVGSSNQECHNVLLDLRCGSKKSLADPPNQCLALKSCDISSTRPHQLLVGGSDSFARLYDRRMLPPLSSCQTKMKPPKCVNYFCPMHLSERLGSARRSSLHLTHVAFSPNGEEVLLSYSGEHVYLMEVNHSSQNSMRYSAGDYSKHIRLAPISCESEIPFPLPIVSAVSSVKRNNIADKLDMYHKLVQVGEKSLKEASAYMYGIEACCEVLDRKGPEIGDALRHECLCNRAALFLKRKWKNDVHMAIRDCNKARKINPLSFRAHYYMSEALAQLGELKEALDYAIVARHLAPSSIDVSERVESIKVQIAAAEAKKTDKEKEERTNTVRTRSSTPFSDILLRTEVQSDVDQEGRSERDDSDFEEELELGFETSMSDDEGHENESNVLQGSLRLRFHRREEADNVNDSSGSPSSSSQNLNTDYQPEIAVDMKQRYAGHCNVGTDIKQASFLGQKGEYVASGSDDGRWYIWEKSTGRLMKLLLGDESVVNCIQCHPFDCTIATSGIDSTIKIWTPHAQVQSIVDGGAAGPETADILSIIERNQRKLSETRQTVLPYEFLERFRMQEFAEGTIHPFECTQT